MSASDTRTVSFARVRAREGILSCSGVSLRAKSLSHRDLPRVTRALSNLSSDRCRKTCARRRAQVRPINTGMGTGGALGARHPGEISGLSPGLRVPAAGSGPQSAACRPCRQVAWCTQGYTGWCIPGVGRGGIYPGGTSLHPALGQWPRTFTKYKLGGSSPSSPQLPGPRLAGVALAPLRSPSLLARVPERASTPGGVPFRLSAHLSGG